MSKYSSMKGKRLGRSFWRARIAEYERSGLTQRAFVDKYGLTMQTFRRWRKRLKADSSALVAAEPVRFVELAAAEPIRGEPFRLRLGAVCLETSELPPAAYVAAVHLHIEAASRC